MLLGLFRLLEVGRNTHAINEEGRHQECEADAGPAHRLLHGQYDDKRHGDALSEEVLYETKHERAGCI